MQRLDIDAVAANFSSPPLLFDCRSVLAILSSPPFFLLSQIFWRIWQDQATMGPRAFVSIGERRG